MIFVHLSGDIVRVYEQWHCISIQRHEVDSLLTTVLLDIYARAPFSDILVLNGPWWFTNLRVWVLVLHLLRHFVASEVQFHTVTKYDLYTFLVAEGMLPPKGIVYIGQTKNVRLCDFIAGIHALVSIDSLSIDADMFIDDLSDAYFAPFNNQKVSFALDSDKLVVSYRWSNYSFWPTMLPVLSTDVLEPAYMIEPVIW